MNEAPAGDVARPAHHCPGGGFRNPPGSPRQTATLGDFLRFLLLDMRRAKLPPIPTGLVAAAAPDLATLAENQLAWLGHACFAFRMAGKLVLTDPYLSRTAGPFGLGPRRFLDAAVQAEALPQLDLIAISHNHYDHLDTRALGAYRFASETPVVCPLGLASLLKRQGFKEVIELDWWEEWRLEDLAVTCLPAVHFSGRGLGDRNRTLWASFAFASKFAGPLGRKLWFGGDSAPGAVFREIGARAGPFDLALVGIGAYEPRNIMQASHATPEEAIGIAREIGANAAVGMHWGSIMLTPENPFEAPHRFRQAALEQQYGQDNAWVMQVGEVRGF